MSRQRFLQAMQSAISEEMQRDRRVVVFGEDVRISVFGATRGLVEEFGPERVRNTPISEQTIIGTALGAAATGLRPIADLMTGNFLYTGMDQIANQIAKLPYMTGGQMRLPLVLLATTGAAGGNAAQHSDSPYPALMNLGGLKIVVPSTPADAKGLFKSAIRDDNPVVFLQQAAIGGLRGEVPDEVEWLVPLGVADVKRAGGDVTVVAIGMMVRRAMEAAVPLAADGIEIEVVDPRTLAPLDFDTILASVEKTGRLVVVDEARQTCSAASEISATVAERGFRWLKAPIQRVASHNVPMPYSRGMENFVVPDQARIVAAVRSAMGG